MLVWIISLLKWKYRGISNPAVLLHGVRPGSEGQDWLVIGGKPRESQLGQIMDKEIKLCGHAAQTGFHQPIRKKGGGKETGIKMLFRELNK